MNTMKVIGFVTGGIVLAALIGGGIVWWRRRKQKTDGLAPNIPDARPAPTPGPAPSGPPRPTNTEPRGHYVEREMLDDEFIAAIDKMFPSAWPPNDAAIESLEKDDVIIFAVESEPTGNYTNTQQELINAKVLTVEKTVVRGRVFGTVAHAEHHGSHAGHGFRVGDLVEVPRGKILVAARPNEPKTPSGYDSLGKPAETLKPTDLSKNTYKVKPGTPYDLVLPYRTPELAWHVDEKLVKVVHIGQKANFEQIMFTEDSLRGQFSITALDEDPEVGTVFVAQWKFVLDA